MRDNDKTCGLARCEPGHVQYSIFHAVCLSVFLSGLCVAVFTFFGTSTHVCTLFFSGHPPPKKKKKRRKKSDCVHICTEMRIFAALTTGQPAELGQRLKLM